MKLAGIKNTPFTEDWHRKRNWYSVIPYLRPTKTRTHAISAMAIAKQETDFNKVDIEAMSTMARHSRLRGLNRKMSRGENLTKAELKHLDDLDTLGTSANPNPPRKLREMEVADMDKGGRRSRRQKLKAKIARFDMLTAVEVRQARDFGLAIQAPLTGPSSKLRRASKRKLRDMEIKDMDVRSKIERKRTLKQKISRSDALTPIDIRQARDLGLM